MAANHSASERQQLAVGPVVAFSPNIFAHSEQCLYDIYATNDRCVDKFVPASGGDVGHASSVRQWDKGGHQSGFICYLSNREI